MKPISRNLQTGLALFVIAALLLAGASTGSPQTAQAAPQGPLTSGLCGSDASLVGCWLFDEGSGTTTADGSGNGNIGTLVMAHTWVADRSRNAGKALHFDGVRSQYVRVPDADSLDVTGDITIAAWVKPEQLTTSTW